MFENPRRGRQARNFTTNVPKILVLKSSSEQIFSRKLPLGAPDKLEALSSQMMLIITDYKLFSERNSIMMRPLILISGLGRNQERMKEYVKISRSPLVGLKMTALYKAEI